MAKMKKLKLLLSACCGPCSTVALERLQNDYDITILFYGNNLDTAEEFYRRLTALETVNKALNNGKPIILIDYCRNDFIKEIANLLTEPTEQNDLEVNVGVPFSQNETNEIPVGDTISQNENTPEKDKQSKQININAIRGGGTIEKQSTNTGKTTEGGERCRRCFELRLTATAQMAKLHGFELFATTLTTSPHKNAEIINQIGETAAAEYGVKYLPTDFKQNGGFNRSVELSKQLGLYRQKYCGCNIL